MYITPAPPGPMFHGRYPHTWNNRVGAKGRRCNHLAESFPKTYYRSVLASSPLGCRAIELGKNRLRGCVIYTGVYGSVRYRCRDRVRYDIDKHKKKNYVIETISIFDTWKPSFSICNKKKKAGMPGDGGRKKFDTYDISKVRYFDIPVYF